MKKLLFLLCLISFSGYSQHGLRIGTNNATYSYIWRHNLDFSLGFYFGGVSRLKLGEVVSVRPELTYYQSRYKVESEFGSNQWSSNWTDHWLSLTTNLEFFITKKISILTGLGYNYRLLSTLKERGEDYSNSETINYDHENFQDRLLMSGNIGLCYTINDFFLIDLRYDGSVEYDGSFLGEGFKLDLSEFRQLISLGVGVLF